MGCGARQQHLTCRVHKQKWTEAWSAERGAKECLEGLCEGHHKQPMQGAVAGYLLGWQQAGTGWVEQVKQLGPCRGMGYGPSENKAWGSIPLPTQAAGDTREQPRLAPLEPGRPTAAAPRPQSALPAGR